MSITLTASMRSNLSSLKVIQKQMDTTQERLSTGKKVNSAIDNASSFYQSRALTNRAADLDALLDSMGQGVQTIQAANEGIEAVTAFVDQLKSVATSAYAAAAGGATDVSSYQSQYNAILKEVKTLIEDSGYQGINLLNGGKLTVTFDENRVHSLAVQGDSVTAKLSEGTGVKAFKWKANGDGDISWAASAAHGDPEDDDYVPAKSLADAVSESLDAISKGMEYLRDYTSKMGNNYSIIQTRQDFTQSMIDVLETGSDNLILADMNEESANYLALQTRQQLAINSLSLASQSAQSVLKLF
jgi:flagellin-like hook-associated protein FlgL